MKFNIIAHISAMSKKSYLLFLAFLFIMTVHAKNSYALNTHSDYVLIVNTYTPDAPWSNDLIEPVQKWMNETNTPVFIEHLNMLMINDAEDFSIVEEATLSKYANHAPKAILLLGNPSLLLKDNIRNYWGDVPMILCAEHDFYGPDQAYIRKEPIAPEDRMPFSSLTDQYNLTVLNTRIFIPDNIHMLQKLFPRMREVVLIGDNRYVNQQLDYDTKRLMAKEYPDLDYHYYSAGEMTLDSLMAQLDSVETGSTGILFSSWFTKTEIAGQAILNANSYRVIANMSAPVFALKSSIMSNSGMVGGCFYDEEYFLQQLKQTLAAVIAGTPAREIPSFIPQEAVPTFNYPALIQNGLSEKQCPRNSVFIGRPENYLQKYKYLLLGGAIIILVFIVSLYHRIRILRKLSEVQQKEVETSCELTSLFENMPIAYTKTNFIYGKSGEIVDMEIQRMNGRFMKIFAPDKNAGSYKVSKLLGNDFAIAEHFAELAHTEQKTITYAQYFARPNIYLNIVVTPAAQKNHVDVFCIDATELYLTQQKLYDTNKKLAMALDVANIVPWNWNLKEHKILCDVNRPIELSDNGQDINEEKLSVPDTQYFSKILKEDKVRVENAYRDLIEGRSSKVREEYRVVTRNQNGHQIDWVEAQATVEKRDADGNPLTLVGSSLVITKRKQMEQELINARDKAEESNRLKSAFLANMSHEIRTPLNAIVGFSSLLNTAEEDQEREEYVKIIENNNELLLQLIGDILDLSKIEAGTMEFVETAVDVNALMEEIIKAMRMKASTKGLDIILADHLPECVILTDRNRLSQVLMNLITNAIKFTDTGSITIGYTSQKGGMLRFYVTDTGCGIPAEKQADIFTRFVKLNSFAQGTGLGLPICKTIVNKMGGEISVESEPEKGSTFWFTIRNTPAQITEKKKQEHTLKAVAKDNITILIAEDHMSNFKLFETILQKDYRILHAWNGMEAVRLFKQHNPHIVLMDINMPEMDGYQATDEIRKLSPDVPILAITAYAYATDEQQILSRGFDGYTSKPINPNVLQSKISDLLSTRLLLL